MRAIGNMSRLWAMARHALIEISGSETSTSQENASVTGEKMFANAHPLSNSFFHHSPDCLNLDLLEADQALCEATAGFGRSAFIAYRP